MLSAFPFSESCDKIRRKPFCSIHKRFTKKPDKEPAMGKVYGDEITAKDQWNKLKGHPFKEKAEFIAQYYGILIVAVILFIIAAISITKSVIYNSVPNIISGDFYSLQINQGKEDDVKNAICEYLGYDPEEYHISLGNSFVASSDSEAYYYQSMKLIAQINAKDLDFIIADQATVDQYMQVGSDGYGCFADLRDFIPADMLAEFESEGRVLYYEPKGEGISIEPYPYLVKATHTKLFDMVEAAGLEDSYIAIAINTERKEAVRGLFELLR